MRLARAAEVFRMRRATPDLSARLRDERGVALVMALGFLLILSMGFATSMVVTTAGARHAFSSNADQKAYALAELGMNNAAAVVFGDANRQLAKSVDCANPASYATYAALLPSRTTPAQGGSVTWSGQLVCDGSSPYWRLTSIASVTNPTGPGSAAITRRTTASVPLDATEEEVEVIVNVGQTIEMTSTAWQEQVTTSMGSTTATTTTSVYDSTWSGGSFLYSFGDVDLTGGSSTEQAIIAEGNLLLGGGGWIAPSASVVSVRGTIDAGTSQSQLGMGVTTLLTGPMTATSTSASVTSTSGFPSSGTIKVDKEYMSYSGKTATSFTGLTRGVNGAAYPAASHAKDAIVGVAVPTLTAALSASATTAFVTSVTGFRISVAPDKCSATSAVAGMFKIDSEYITYRCTGITNTQCGGTAPCFKFLVRGYVPGATAQPHASGTAVDARLSEVQTAGGCVANCGQIHSDKLMGTDLIQDRPGFTKPTFDVVAARNGAAPGPNHLAPATNPSPQPSCPISFASTGGSPGNPYWRTGSVDLTPTAGYTCKATGGAYPAPAGADYADGTGELSWNNTTKVLKVRGVVFLPIDTVTMTQGARYDAPAPGAVLYVGGQFKTAGNLLCGKAIVSGTCDQTWNPNLDGNLAVVSLNVPSPYANPVHKFTFSSGSFFQGLIYTDGEMEATGGATVSGTAFAQYIKYGGGGVAPAPGLFAVPTGFGTPRVVTTTTTLAVPVVSTTTTPVVSTYTTTVTNPTTVTTTTTVRTPGAPRDFGG